MQLFNYFFEDENLNFLVTIVLIAIHAVQFLILYLLLYPSSQIVPAGLVRQKNK